MPSWSFLTIDEEPEGDQAEPGGHSLAFKSFPPGWELGNQRVMIRLGMSRPLSSVISPLLTVIWLTE
jgi:hypothetical protein